MRVAAMDLGTNSFHLLVADVHPDGHIDPIVREKEMLRLGDVVSRHGHIPPTAADQAVATVRRFRMLAEAASTDEILARATSAIRRATNGADVVDRIEEETGVQVDVISGHEEARLIFGAVRASVVLDPAPALCFDLGGGSLEVMVGDTRGMQWATSVPLGVARLTTELVHSDPVGKRDRRALRERIEEELTPVRAAVAGYSPRMAVGSSGTLEALAHMTAARRDEDVPSTLNQLTITRDEYLVVHKEILGSTADERLRFAGLDARRVDLVVAGSMLLATAMELFDMDSLTISEWALREGIVLDAVRRHDPADWSDDPRAIRRESVIGLARRCNWPEAHARTVARLALELFDATAEVHDPALGARRPRAARARRARARHRRARVEQRAPPPRRLPGTERAAARLRGGRGGDARGDRPLAPPRRATRVRRVPAGRRRRDGSRPRAGRDPAGGRRPGPQPGGHRRRDRRDGDAVARARAHPNGALRRRGARGVGRTAKAHAARARVGSRGRVHEPPRGPRRGLNQEQQGSRMVGVQELVVRSPYDGHEVGRVPACGAEEVGRAVAAARDSLAAPLPAWRRAEILDRAARLLDERSEEFARIIAEEAAKPIKTARVEARRVVSTFTFAAAEARTLSGEMVPMDASEAGEGKLAFVLRLPVGVVGAISPFNFPLNLVAHKVAPAIAAGCPVVLKPASQTPLSAIALAGLLVDECGLPAEHLTVVTGSGANVGDPLVDHPDVALITFTGSPEVGWAIRGRAARKKVGLELGNNAPVIIEPARRPRVGGGQDRGGGFQPRRAVVHLDATGVRARIGRARVPRRPRPPGRRPRGRRPARRGHRRVGVDLVGRP